METNRGFTKSNLISLVQAKSATADTAGTEMKITIDSLVMDLILFYARCLRWLCGYIFCLNVICLDLGHD